MFGLSTTVARILVGLAAALCIVGFFYVQSCQQRRQDAAEGRLKDEQTGALGDSAKDAIKTQGDVAGRERESEALGRQNEKEIRDAEGASDAVNPAVRDAGLRSLCRRPAYRDSQRCKLLQPPAR